MLTNIRIVLINTSHPGNIGSAARAMKTMGLTELYLVAPLMFPHKKAQEMASTAADVVESAVVVKHLDQALEGCHLVVGASARSRKIPWPTLSPRELGEKASQESAQGKVAILFGNEQSGLTNEELHRCHYHVHIPSNPEYSSLNVASAVQVIAYECRVACLQEVVAQPWDYALATVDAMEGLYQHLEKVMIDLEFLNPEVPRQLMARVRRLFNRAQPDVMELNILRGILAAMERKLAE
jgi:tRNA (cytidine32/uridine32-2'-O)-methyltransferase